MQMRWSRLLQKCDNPKCKSPYRFGVVEFYKKRFKETSFEYCPYCGKKKLTDCVDMKIGFNCKMTRKE